MPRMGQATRAFYSSMARPHLLKPVQRVVRPLPLLGGCELGLPLSGLRQLQPHLHLPHLNAHTSMSHSSGQQRR